VKEEDGGRRERTEEEENSCRMGKGEEGSNERRESLPVVRMSCILGLLSAPKFFVNSGLGHMRQLMLSFHFVKDKIAFVYPEQGYIYRRINLYQTTTESAR